MFLISLSLVSANYLPERPLLSPQSCNSYSCAPSSKSKPLATSCLWKNTTSPTSFYLWPCSSNTFCNTTTGNCEAKAIQKPEKFIGDNCSPTLPCSTGTCLSGVCKGLSTNQKCTFHSQCDSGLRCYSGNSTCQPQLSVGQYGCQNFLDCVNWATCNLSGSKGTCVEYASAALGSSVHDCVNGFSYICALGSCRKTGFFSTAGVCVYPPVSYSAKPKSCTTDSDCLGSQSGEVVTSDCICGDNVWGKSFCTPFLGDAPGQNMIKVWTSALKKAGQCNTAARSSDECMKSIGMFKNTSQATLGYYSYPLYLFNDDCVKVNMNNEYWFDFGMMLTCGVLVLLT